MRARAMKHGEFIINDSLDYAVMLLDKAIPAGAKLIDGDNVKYIAVGTADYGADERVLRVNTGEIMNCGLITYPVRVVRWF
jgi:hypothetical protein